MKQTATFISTYSADTFGVCSALFELGGMVVMHDPSGCNSTYTTHDEPRWFDMDSQIYISGLTEMDAILGNDQRLIKDITETALLQKPAFICIVASQIPALIGCDLQAAARMVEKNTGIRTFCLSTNSMHYYALGIYLALEAMAKLIIKDHPKSAAAPGNHKRVNILGLTPLDFSVNGCDKSICGWLEENGFSVISRWAMGSTLEDLQDSHQADVNLVVSYGGLGAARIMERAWGIPYIIGIPFGGMKKRLLQRLEPSCREPSSIYAYLPSKAAALASSQENKIILIGESVFSCSLAAALEEEYQQPVRVICPVETEDFLLRPGDVRATDETELEPLFSSASVLIADPLYRAICPSNVKFIELPHEGFSGRLYRKYIPNLMESFHELKIDE